MIQVISDFAILVLVDVCGGGLTSLIVKHFINKRENNRHDK